MMWSETNTPLTIPHLLSTAPSDSFLASVLSFVGRRVDPGPKGNIHTGITQTIPWGDAYWSHSCPHHNLIRGWSFVCLVTAVLLQACCYPNKFSLKYASSGRWDFKVERLRTLTRCAIKWNFVYSMVSVLDVSQGLLVNELPDRSCLCGAQYP